MANETKKKQRELYDLSEVEDFLRVYRKWWDEGGKDWKPPVSTQDDSGSNPGTKPPPPPFGTP